MDEMVVPPPNTLKVSTIVLGAGAALWSRSPGPEQYVLAVALLNTTCVTVREAAPAPPATYVPVAVIGPSGAPAAAGPAGYVASDSATVPDWEPPSATETLTGTS